MRNRLSRTAGRTAFGRDPAAYDAARPDYPSEVYAILAERCGLGPGTRTLEVGAGTGRATRELLRRGATPLTAVEPDPRLARYLRASLGSYREKVRVVVAPFERADLPEGAFDLGVSATAFHWLNERAALRKVARLLRPGGWWAAWWNVFGDPARPSAWHRALDPLYRTIPSGPSSPTADRPPFQMDRRAREQALRGTGRFRRVSSTVVRGSVVLSTARVTALYATYSPIATLPAPKRRWFLGEVARVADEEFGGRVTIRLLTPVYTAERG